MTHTNKRDIKSLITNQRSNEQVILLLRRHWIVWLQYIVQLFASTIIPIAVGLATVYIFNVTIPTTGPLFVGIVMIVSLYYLATWLMYFHQFVDYRLDTWIITNERIIDMQQLGLFDRVISELNINKVQDVTAEVHGQIQTFLDYGNVYIQTAGVQERFIFYSVPHPEEVARLIIQVNDMAMNKLNATQHINAQNT